MFRGVAADVIVSFKSTVLFQGTWWSPQAETKFEGRVGDIPAWDVRDRVRRKRLHTVWTILRRNGVV